MSVTFEAFSITVPGNVVKSFTNDGKDSSLRLTQEQGQSLYDTLGPTLEFLKNQVSNGSAPAPAAPAADSPNPPFKSAGAKE